MACGPNEMLLDGLPDAQIRYQVREKKSCLDSEHESKAHS